MKKEYYILYLILIALFYSQPAFAQSREELVKVQEFINAGTTSFNRSDYKTAIENYSKAINIYTKLPVLYYNRGTAYLLEKDYDSAIKDFGAAIEKGNSLPEKRRAERGLAFQSKGDYAKAVEDFNQAASLNPAEVRIFINRGNS